MKKTLAISIIILALLGANAGAWYYGEKTIKNQQKNFAGQVAVLQKQIAELNKKIGAATQSAANSALSLEEVQNRQAAHEKSQDELLTAAVAKVTPAVVSIVISKDVPQLQVVYQNPFGDDPFFKDFNIQVPTYQQNGTVRQKVGAGSGFFVTQNGYILTNKHVVADDQADYTVLTSTGKQLPAKVIYKDPNNDVAVIKVDGSNFPKADFGDSAGLKLGQTVIAIGNALGEYNNSVSVGIISGLNRTIEASGQGSTEQLSGVIQTDAAINPGNSGGPLLDLNGNIMGVNVATVVGSNNISFSIPINTVREIIKSVIPK